MNFQRINCLGCDYGEQKLSCKECLNLLPPPAFYTYSDTGKLYKKCIPSYNAKVECNCRKLVNRTNLNNLFCLSLKQFETV